MKYLIVSQRGMSPFSWEGTIGAAIASSVEARKLGLSGEIVPDAEATPADCHEAAELLGWDCDPDAADMDRPVSANIVASDLATHGQIRFVAGERDPGEDAADRRNESQGGGR